MAGQGTRIAQLAVTRPTRARALTRPHPLPTLHGIWLLDYLHLFKKPLFISSYLQWMNSPVPPVLPQIPANLDFFFRNSLTFSVGSWRSRNKITPWFWPLRKFLRGFQRIFPFCFREIVLELFTSVVKPSYDVLFFVLTTSVVFWNGSRMALQTVYWGTSRPTTRSSHRESKLRHLNSRPWRR